MKLITEHTDNNLEYITEKNAKGEKQHFIEGIFMQAEQKNRNNRIYPMNVLKAATDKYVKEQVSKGRAVGELDHPAGGARRNCRSQETGKWSPSGGKKS